MSDPTYDRPVEKVTPPKIETEADAVNRAVSEAEQQATAARQNAERVRKAAAMASQARADAIQATKAVWQTIHETAVEKTDRLVMEGGYLIRSVWRHFRTGVPGAEPLSGSSLTFVPGTAPALPTAGVLAVTVADLKPGVDPMRATLTDLHPITQLASSPEVLLFLPDGRVRVLKSRDASTVGVIRDATPVDGPAPVVDRV